MRLSSWKNFSMKQSCTHAGAHEMRPDVDGVVLTHPMLAPPQAHEMRL